jgi:alpha-methylacyl-CoA racemase
MSNVEASPESKPLPSHPAPASPRPGALNGVRIIEFAGLGPCPLAGMLLADMGADVIVIERSAHPSGPGAAATHRNKRRVVLNLKNEADLQAVWGLLDGAQALIEGYRPGVMERLGLSPEAVAQRNPELVYGRVTGWGQAGPLAQRAGHDINYLALTGVMSITAHQDETPMAPATLVADAGGGALYLAFGVVCALLEAQRSGKGQVVDAAMVDGVASMAAIVQNMRSIGYWRDDAAHNYFLGTSPFYDTFACADGKHISLGAIEGPFYAEMLQRLGLTDVDPSAQHDSHHWPALRARVAACIATRTRAQWCEAFEGSDACFAPVLSFAESQAHPHLRARGTWVRVGDGVQPAVAPRLSRTPGALPGPNTAPTTLAALMATTPLKP